MHVKKVYDNGQIYDASILDITADDIITNFQKNIENMAALSLGSGYTVKPAIPHLLGNAFKNLASVTFVSNYSFKQAEALKEAVKNQVVVSGTGNTNAGAKKEEEKPKEEEKVEEEADVDMGNLFGDDYWLLP